STGRKSGNFQLEYCFHFPALSCAFRPFPAVRPRPGFKKDENADVENDRNKLLPSCNHHNNKSLNHTKHAARRTIINYERVIDKPLTVNSNLKAYRIYKSNDAGNYAVYRPSHDIQNARIVRRKNNRTSQMKIYDSEEFFSCEEE
ncbi:unnamed protein product, partial [Rotaria socialis]